MTHFWMINDASYLSSIQKQKQKSHPWMTWQILKIELSDTNHQRMTEVHVMVYKSKVKVAKFINSIKINVQNQC